MSDVTEYHQHFTKADYYISTKQNDDSEMQLSSKRAHCVTKFIFIFFSCKRHRRTGVRILR